MLPDQNVQERLKAVEAKLLEQGVAKLEQMQVALEMGFEPKMYKKCKHAHIEEQVKLVHRMRSLLSKEE